ncbi:hypothetical protein DFH07DRAFT_795218, partial [Mycena maculata]
VRLLRGTHVCKKWFVLILPQQYQTPLASFLPSSSPFFNRVLFSLPSQPAPAVVIPMDDVLAHCSGRYGSYQLYPSVRWKWDYIVFNAITPPSPLLLSLNCLHLVSHPVIGLFLCMQASPDVDSGIYMLVALLGGGKCVRPGGSVGCWGAVSAVMGGVCAISQVRIRSHVVCSIDIVNSSMILNAVFFIGSSM